MDVFVKKIQKYFLKWYKFETLKKLVVVQINWP